MQVAEAEGRHAADALFEHYKRTAATRLPRDLVRYLPGYFIIRRTRHADRPFIGGKITSAESTSFHVHDPVRQREDEIALAVLVEGEDAILFHSQGDMTAVFSCLVRALKTKPAA
jgi:hypothetical protein